MIRDILDKMKGTFGKSKKVDVHTRLMRAYKPVPMWWFYVILVLNIALIMFACNYYADILQLPWWGVLLACAIAIAFTLPIGIISATTNQVNLCITVYIFFILGQIDHVLRKYESKDGQFDF